MYIHQDTSTSLHCFSGQNLIKWLQAMDHVLKAMTWHNGDWSHVLSDKLSNGASDGFSLITTRGKLSCRVCSRVSCTLPDDPPGERRSAISGCHMCKCCHHIIACIFRIGYTLVADLTVNLFLIYFLPAVNFKPQWNFFLPLELWASVAGWPRMPGVGRYQQQK